jgi:hypothetical protein
LWFSGFFFSRRFLSGPFKEVACGEDYSETFTPVE